MNEEIRDRTVGELSDRVFALEERAINRWEDFFGKKPWVVVSIIIVALSTAFWRYYTWQIERIDKLHQQEISRILKENESKIEWLKEQQKIKLESENDKHEIDKHRLSAQIELCKKSKKIDITK